MEKILVFSNGEKMGDGIIKLPFIFEIFKHFQNSKITWLAHGTTVYSTSLKKVSSRYLFEVIYNSNLNILPWQKISDNYNFNNKFYDIIIDTQKTVYKTLALKRIKSKIFVSSTASWIFSDIKPKNRTKEKKYYLDNLYDMLELTIKKKIIPTNNYFFSKKLENELKILFKEKKPCIGIAPGAGEQNRKWNIENFIEVAKYFMKKGYKIAFFTGPDDFDEKKSIINFFTNPFFPEDLINNYPGFEIVMASTKFMTCSLANDSGVGHMLSTSLCPHVKLFSHHDPQKFSPRSSMIHTISSLELGSVNINTISVKNVIETIEKLI